MLGGIGVFVLVAIVVVVVAAAVLAVLHFRFGLLGRGKGRRPGKSSLLDQPRIEVLESTPVDADRSLVLVRCDRVEHLIMVGGPADLVVENDVKKTRGPGTPAPKTPVPEADRSAAAALLGTGGGGSRPAAERPSPASRPSVRPGTGHHETSQPRQQHSETQFGRRESGTQQRRTIQPAPLGGGQRPEPQPAAGRGNGRQQESPSLPSAGVPWAEPDSIENEIVQALRFDPVPRGDDAAKPRQPATPKSSGDPSTTLGDLADKLEEALAEEVQSASQTHGKPDVDVNEFAFDTQSSSGNAERRSGSASEQRSRPSRKEEMRPARDRSSASSEQPEPRRETPKSAERREEAPVISLNSRRRENADPLEDEMARLLGELTGDTKGR